MSQLAFGQTQYFFREIGLEQGLPVRRINDMAQDSAGFYWLASEGAGLVRYDGYNFKSYYKDRFPLISGVTCIGDSALAFVQADSLYLFVNEEIKTVKAIPGDCEFLDFRAGSTIRCEDSSSLNITDQFTLVRSNNVSQVMESKNRIVNDSTILLGGHLNISPNNGLPNAAYHQIFKDRLGQWWFMSNEGLVEMQNEQEKLLRLPARAQKAIWHRDKIYAATSRGLLVKDPLSEKVTVYPLGLALDITVYRDEVYLATEEGLYRFSNGRFREFVLPGANFIFSLKSTSEALWVGSGSGIYKIQDEEITNIQQKENLPAATIFKIDQGNDGSLWFGTYTSGYFRYHEGNWTTITNWGGHDLRSGQFSSFAAVNKEEIFLGTFNDGIYLSAAKESQHLPFEEVEYSEIHALNYHETNLWIGTNKGYCNISRQAFKSNDFAELSMDGGSNCIGKGISIEGNRALIATEAGLHLRINKSQQQRRVKPWVSGVDLVLERDVNLWDYGDPAIDSGNLPAGLNLPHDFNYLSLNYGALQTANPREVAYRYRLLGQEEQWTYAGKRREALFPNLKPGNYTFQVQAATSGQVFEAPTASYSFAINTPFWQTWWFISSLVVALGSVAYFYIKDRVERTNRQLKLEKSLLESERKAMRLQMNPHFIFNALDSISSFIFKNDPKQAVRYLNNFAKLMRLTLESSMGHIHPVETEVSILKNYLELEKLRFSNKFDFDICVDEEIDYNVGIPPMLIQPHVENAILHGLKPKEDTGHIWIRFYLENDLLVCEIEDNGIGREAAAKLNQRSGHRSRATQINQDRMQLLRKAMQRELELDIVDLYDDAHQARGTKVVMKLPIEEL